VKQLLNRLSRLHVEDFATFYQQRVVRHFLGQSVLEKVDDVKNRRLCIEKLFVLKGGKDSVELVFRLRDDMPHQVKRKGAPDHRELLEQKFFFRREPIYACSEHSLDRGRDAQVGRRLREAVIPPFAFQYLFVH
jgi:hypothetical protein